MNSIRQEAERARAGMVSYALLRLERTQLLIPQVDVRVLELTMDMSRENPPAGGVGWISFREQLHPVYAPSPQLEWMTAIADDRPLCALMEAKKGMFGLLCSEVTLVKSEELTLFPIPRAMATADTPFQQLAMHMGTLACLASAESLFAHLPSWGSEV